MTVPVVWDWFTQWCIISSNQSIELNKIDHLYPREHLADGLIGHHHTQIENTYISFFQSVSSWCFLRVRAKAVTFSFQPQYFLTALYSIFKTVEAGTCQCISVFGQRVEVVLCLKPISNNFLKGTAF